MIIKQASNTRKVLANNIVHFRLQNGWSQEEFAYKLKSTASYVSALENAKRNIRVDYVDHIAKTLKVEVTELFENRDKIDNHRLPRRYF